MDLDMYAHPSTSNNIKTLQSYGNQVLDVGEGFLASGLEGKGRMLEVEEIVAHVVSFFNPKLPLKNQKVLITAGPTYEAIDPVRFIGNHASGKMGFALAEVAIGMGAAVTLISGPSAEKYSHPSLHQIHVVSADEMLAAVQEFYDTSDIAIAAAAVADFKPQKIASQKLKKEEGFESISLVPTVDVLSYMGKHKKNQKLIGFALETENELENAQAKLKRKNLDGIVLNSLQDAAAGFSVATNKITFIHADLRIHSYPLQSKLDCAHRIFEQILTL